MNIDKEFILNTFKNSSISPKYINVLVTEKSLKMYQIAFTSKSLDLKNNYELFEYIGDAVLGNAIVWYFYSAFPQLRCSSEIKILNRLKIIHASSESFSDIAISLNFLPRIHASEEEFNDEEKKQHLLEDVFEAFIGVTKIVLTEHFGLPGIGDEIVYNFISPIFEKKKISFETDDLYDAKTRLKELFDNKTETNPVFVSFGSVIYEENTNNTTIPPTYSTRLSFKNNKNIKFFGIGRTKQAREKNAAQQALEYLKNNGFKIEKQFTPFCV
jgi:dsRNA-specific ribonuclease